MEQEGITPCTRPHNPLSWQPPKVSFPRQTRPGLCWPLLVCHPEPSKRGGHQVVAPPFILSSRAMIAGSDKSSCAPGRVPDARKASGHPKFDLGS